jgi:hypothetical protein
MQTRGIVSKLGLVALAASLMGIVAITSAYGLFKNGAVAATERHGLPAHAANSIKHAYAAAETYALLRAVAVPAGTASQIVYRLGQTNEYAEYYGRRREKRDPTREIYKDLYNNTAGIVAAAFLETGAGPIRSSERLALIAWMTRQSIVLHSFADRKIPAFQNGDDPLSSDLSLALASFKRDRAAITRALWKLV